MIPTWARPGTSVFCPGPWPCTSAEGLSTRRYSAGRRNRRPLSKPISSTFSACLRRSSIGQGAGAPAFNEASLRRRQALGRDFVVAQPPRLVDQHDGDPVADRIGEPGLVADQLLRLAVIPQGRLGQRADEDFEKARIDLGGALHGRE